MKEMKLPPPYCSALCRNAMNEKCIESCALKRDCTGFEVKPALKLIDMPRFPIDAIQNMTREEKFTVVAVYLAKTVEHLQGESNVPTYPIRRPNLHNSSSSQVSTSVPIQSVLHGITQAITYPEVREVNQSEAIRSTEVAQPAD
jgi:hypothetical protein